MLLDDLPNVDQRATAVDALWRVIGGSPRLLDAPACSQAARAMGRAVAERLRRTSPGEYHQGPVERRPGPAARAAIGAFLKGLCRRALHAQRRFAIGAQPRTTAHSHSRMLMF